jgi:hypothetical protein
MAMFKALKQDDAEQVADGLVEGSGVDGEQLIDPEDERKPQQDEIGKAQTTTVGTGSGSKTAIWRASQAEVMGAQPSSQETIDALKGLTERASTGLGLPIPATVLGGIETIAQVLEARGSDNPWNFPREIASSIDLSNLGSIASSYVPDTLSEVEHLIEKGVFRGDNVSENLSDLWDGISQLERERGSEAGEGLRENADDEGDVNRDGVYDATDVAINKAGAAIRNEIRLLHPLIAKDPDIMRRKIKRRPILDENIYKQTNQVNLVEQGMAGYTEYLNQFNVSF